MKPIDLLLLAALALLCVAISLVSVPVALVVGSVGCCALWYFLGDDS